METKWMNEIMQCQSYYVETKQMNEMMQRQSYYVYE